MWPLTYKLLCKADFIKLLDMVLLKLLSNYYNDTKYNCDRISMEWCVCIWSDIGITMFPTQKTPYCHLELCIQAYIALYRLFF